jgi:hypothetical protein
MAIGSGRMKEMEEITLRKIGISFPGNQKVRNLPLLR